MPEQASQHPIPVVTQYATPGLICAIAYQGHPAGDDPGWRTSGVPDQQTYAYWCRRWCGMACLRMALIARDGNAPTLYALFHAALKYGVYIQGSDGTVGGLFYQPFTEFAADMYSLRTEVITDLTPDRLAAETGAGRLVITSVHKEIRRPHLDAPGRGGHLVLVTDYRDRIVHFRNPSGHTPETVNAALLMQIFDRFSAHRGIALHI